MDPQELFNELKAVCIVQPTDKKVIKPKKINHDKMWSCLFDIAAQSVRTLGMYYPLVLIYQERYPDFRENNPKVVSKYLEKYSNEKLSFEEMTRICGPLALLLPFLSIRNAIKFFDISVNIAFKYIKENNNVPLEFIDVFDEIMTEDFQPTTITAIYSHICKLIGTEKRAAALFILAPISHDIIQVCEGADKFIVDTAMDLINKERFDIVCACFLLEYLSVSFESDPDIAPPAETLASTLLPLLTKEDRVVRKRAYRAFKSLIQQGVFETAQIVTLFLSKFNDFNDDELISEFFKLVSTFIYPDDDGDEEDEERSREVAVLQPILDFSVQTLKTSDSALVRGHCLDTLADLAGRDQMFVEDCYQDALRQAEVLVAEDHVEAYPWLSAFFVAMTKCYMDESKDIIKKYLPKLVNAIRDEKAGSQKDRLNLAADISVMIGDGLADELLPDLANFAIEFLDSDKIKEMMNSCAIFISLRPKLTEELANKVFELAAKRAMVVMESEALNILVQTMRKLMKRFSINETVAESFTRSIVEGKLAILYGQPPHLSKPPELFLFLYLERYVRRFPHKGSQLCGTLIGWISKAPFPVIPAILEPINAGLETSQVSEVQARELTGILKILLPQLDHHDVEELSATCATLKEIYDIYPNLLNPVIPLLEHLKKVVSVITIEPDEDNEDEMEDIINATDALPSIAQLVLTIYAIDDSVPVYTELLAGLVSMMPFMPQVKENQELIECLISMMEEPEKFECVVVSTLKAFTELLLMKKVELDEYEFEQDTIKEMKDTLRTVVKSNPIVGKQIAKSLGPSRAKLNRFNALIR
jgi:hypothetical protein